MGLELTTEILRALPQLSQPGTLMCVFIYIIVLSYYVIMLKSWTQTNKLILQLKDEL